MNTCFCALTCFADRYHSGVLHLLWNTFRGLSFPLRPYMLPVDDEKKVHALRCHVLVSLA